MTAKIYVECARQMIQNGIDRQTGKKTGALLLQQLSHINSQPVIIIVN